MEQFSLEKWLNDKSRKVVSRHGNSVRIVCWDRKHDFPIIALEECGNKEFVNFVTSDGRIDLSGLEDNHDLFFADEENIEMTEFEKAVQNVLNEPHFQDVQAVKQFSKSLLDLARKEIENYNERYDRIAQTEQFKKSYCGKSLGKEEPVSEDFEEEIVSWLKNGNITDTRYDNYADSDIEATARHFAEWQKQQDYKMHAHISLKDIHDAWRELKKNKSDIENYPAVCFQKGADWRENHMKELLRTEYEKGRFDMREEMIKDAVETTIVNDWQYGKDQDHAVIPAIHQRIKGFTVGDKIKIIICKPEQQCCML